MNNYFERVLLSAIINCEDLYCEDNETRKGFAKIYPFTTENISEYINLFNFLEVVLMETLLKFFLLKRN